METKRFTTMLAKADYLTYFYEILCEIKNYLRLFYGVLLTYEAAFFSDLNIFYLPPRMVFFQGTPPLRWPQKRGPPWIFYCRV